MARNYFTDVIGATEQAFERGRSSMEQSRQRMGQSRAAKALAQGDVEGAKRAFGEAGMVEQVDTLAQRQRQQREAEAAMASEAEQTAYERQQDLLKQQSEQEQLTYERGQQDRKDKLEFFTNGVTMLSSIPQQNRMQAFETLVPTLQAMGMDEGTIQQLRTAPMDDASLNAMKLALGQEAQKLQASVSTGGATVYNAQTGQAYWVPAVGAPTPRTGGPAEKPPSPPPPPKSLLGEKAATAMAILPQAFSALDRMRGLFAGGKSPLDSPREVAAEFARNVPVVGGAVSKVTGGPDYQAYQTAWGTIQQAVHIPAGAAVSESELQTFMNANRPEVGDNNTTIQTKLRNIGLLLTGLDYARTGNIQGFETLFADARQKTQEFVAGAPQRAAGGDNVESWESYLARTEGKGR